MASQQYGEPPDPDFPIQSAPLPYCLTVASRNRPEVHAAVTTLSANAAPPPQHFPAPIANMASQPSSSLSSFDNSAIDPSLEDTSPVATDFNGSLSHGSQGGYNTTQPFQSNNVCQNNSQNIVTGQISSEEFSSMNTPVNHAPTSSTTENMKMLHNFYGQNTTGGLGAFTPALTPTSGKRKVNQFFEQEPNRTESPYGKRIPSKTEQEVQERTKRMRLAMQPMQPTQDMRNSFSIVDPSGYQLSIQFSDLNHIVLPPLQVEPYIVNVFWCKLLMGSAWPNDSPNGRAMQALQGALIPEIMFRRLLFIVQYPLDGIGMHTVVMERGTTARVSFDRIDGTIQLLEFNLPKGPMGFVGLPNQGAVTDKSWLRNLQAQFLRHVQCCIPLARPMGHIPSNATGEHQSFPPHAQ